MLEAKTAQSFQVVGHSLVETVVGSINNDASHASNSTQQSDDDANDDAEPGRPEMPLQWPRLLDSQPEHRGKAVG